MKQIQGIRLKIRQVPANRTAAECVPECAEAVLVVLLLFNNMLYLFLRSIVRFRGSKSCTSQIRNVHNHVWPLTLWGCVCAYLKRQVVNEGHNAEQDEQQVGKSKGSHGVRQFLDLFVTLRSGARISKGRDIHFLTSCFVSLFTTLSTLAECFRHHFHGRVVPMVSCCRILLLYTLPHPPIHDVANQRARDQAQELQCAEDGRIKAHCGKTHTHISTHIHWCMTTLHNLPTKTKQNKNIHKAS